MKKMKLFTLLAVLTLLATVPAHAAPNCNATRGAARWNIVWGCPSLDGQNLPDWLRAYLPGGNACLPGEDRDTSNSCAPGEDRNTSDTCAPGQNCDASNTCAPGQNCDAAPGAVTPGTSKTNTIAPNNGANTSAPSTNKPDTSATVPDAAKPAPTQTVSGMSDYELEVVRLVNEIRVQNGLSALTADAELSRVARYKSQDMRDKGYFSHTSPTYGSPFDMMKSFGISYRTAGENIAYGYSTPQKVVDGWMNSSGHRANILNSSYTRIGVGYVADGHYWTQMFIG